MGERHFPEGQEDSTMEQSAASSLSHVSPGDAFILHTDWMQESEEGEQWELAVQGPP